MDSAAIQAKNLGRHFQRRMRDQGLGAAVRAFFRPNYSTKVAVEDVSFSIARGACAGLVGANGAGKTTLLKMCAGLLHPSSGQIKIFGFTPSERNRDFLKQIGMVMGQKSQLWIDIPAADSFELLAAIYEIPKNIFQSRLKDLSHLFGVESLLGVQVRKLSLGERMKLEIIASLLHQPKLLFLDEPTIGLDLIAKHNIRNFIRDYNKQFGFTIILSSHDMEDIVEICDRLIIIASGKLKFDGTVNDFNTQSESFTSQIRALISQ